jgi:SAM-dependent methyltransferase
MHFGFELQACHNCGLWAWQDRKPPDYDSVYETSEYSKEQIDPFHACDPADFLTHATYAPFFRKVPFSPGKKLLDVGCGVGRFLLAARTVGWTTRGIDVSRAAVEIGRNGAGLDLSCESFEDLAKTGARFDAVTAFEVLEHVEAPVEFVQSALGLLHVGGYLFCTVPNRESRAVRNTKRPDWLPPVHLQFFTQNALQTALERAGGRDVRTGLVRNVKPGRSLLRILRGVAKQVLTGVRPDPIGLWGMAQR